MVGFFIAATLNCGKKNYYKFELAPSARLRENQNGLTEQMEIYQEFMTIGGAKSYKKITKGDIANPAINVNRLIATEAFNNYPREILSRMTQLRTINKKILVNSFKKESL